MTWTQRSNIEPTKVMMVFTQAVLRLTAYDVVPDSTSRAADTTPTKCLENFLLVSAVEVCATCRIKIVLKKLSYWRSAFRRFKVHITGDKKP